jgi:hypothetical protein
LLDIKSPSVALIYLLKIILMDVFISFVHKYEAYPRLYIICRSHGKFQIEYINQFG